MRNKHARAYWKANVRILFTLLSIWFFISFICGIVLADALDTIRFGGFKLGFWIAQQGSIYVFVGIIITYVFWMDRLDARYHADSQHAPDTNAPGTHKPGTNAANKDTATQETSR